MTCIDNVYIADTGNQRVRKITIATGIITNIAGSNTSGSYNGDNGAATSARLWNPYTVATDSSGRLTFLYDISLYCINFLYVMV